MNELIEAIQPTIKILFILSKKVQDGIYIAFYIKTIYMPSWFVLSHIKIYI